MEDMSRTVKLLALTVVSILALIGSATAQAHGVSGGPPDSSASEAACVIHSLPSFTAQGEFGAAASVADVVEVECEPAYAGSTVTLESQELYERCNGYLAWSTPYGSTPVQESATYSVTLDDDGGATAVLWGGPGCSPGESLVAASLEEAPYTTFTTNFTVKAPGVTPVGLTALPASEVESDLDSSIATVIEVEFPPVDAEKYVNVTTSQLYSRCLFAPHLVWVGADGTTLASSTPSLDRLQLDNDGNAFVVLLGGGSCAAGESLIEASLEEEPYTTYTTTFTVQPPQPTWEEPAFTIDKLQSIQGSGSGFTSAQIVGKIGQTVEYEIAVQNTGHVPLSFSEFSDPRCDAGTVAGGPGSATVAPGETTTYTCDHVLTSVGSYTNVAEVTAVPPTGATIPQSSNQVVVTVPEEPAFIITKKQSLGGSQTGFTTDPLSGVVGETVDYEIVATNTGNVPLTFSHFEDSRCDPGTLSGGPGSNAVAPGEQAAYTCSHVLTEVGPYINQASVTGVTSRGREIPETSAPVEVKATERASGLSFTIEKLQEIVGGTSGFTTSALTGAVGGIIDYEIIVKNTGGVPAEFTAFEDENCAPGTLAGGPDGIPVAPEGETVYTCSRTLTAAGTYLNEASVTGSAPGESLEKTSNRVEASVPGTPALVQPPPVTPPPAQRSVLPQQEVLASCEVSEPAIALQGAAGPKRSTFTVHMSSTGIRLITFYLDGRKLRTLAASQARGGRFSLAINPRRLSYGAHRLSVKTVMDNATLCAPVARTSVFVHPHSQRVKPRFTG